MKKYSKIFRGCLITLLLLISCIGINIPWTKAANWLPIDQVVPNLALPNPVTQDMAALTPVNIQNVEEVFTIQSSSKPDKIVALYQAMDDMNLLVVHESGLFHNWDLETQALEAEYNFIAGRCTGVNFNADGSQVITPGMLVSDDRLYGYSVWDVNTGEMLECYGDHCPSPIPFEEQFAQNGLALSPNGKWVVEYRSARLSYKTLLREPLLLGGESVDTDDFNQKHYSIDQIAFDRSGVYLAVAIEEGILRVYDVDYQFLPKGEEKPLDEHDRSDTVSVRSLTRKYGRYNSNKLIHTSDLAIDDTRTWLGQLTDEELILYDLRKTFFPGYMKVPISNGNLLAFSHSGTLLAVATDDEIIMFDLHRKEQVALFQTGKATALFFTHDDRLLTWGDADGVIHIWGVAGSME